MNGGLCCYSITWVRCRDWGDWMGLLPAHKHWIIGVMRGSMKFGRNGAGWLGFAACVLCLEGCGSLEGVKQAQGGGDAAGNGPGVGAGGDSLDRGLPIRRSETLAVRDAIRISRRLFQAYQRTNEHHGSHPLQSPRSRSSARDQLRALGLPHRQSGRYDQSVAWGHERLLRLPWGAGPG